MPNNLESLLWNLFTLVVLAYLINVASGLTTPRIKRRIDGWLNDRRTRNLAALDREDAKIHALHNDSGELLRYALMKGGEIFYRVLALAGGAVVLLFMATQFPDAPLWGDLTTRGFAGLVLFMSTILALTLTTTRMTGLVITFTNIYEIERWQEYVAERRAQLTKAGAVNS